MLSYLVLLPLIFNTILARRIFHSWFAPASFFSLYWTLAVALPIIATPQEYVSIPAVIFVFFATFAVLAGSLLGMGLLKKSPFRVERIGITEQSIRHIRLGVVISSVLGILSALVAMLDVGFGVRSIFSLYSLVDVANWFSVGRYQGGYTPSIISQVLRIFVFLAPLLGGVLAGIGMTKREILLIGLSLLPALLITVTQTQRGVIIMAGIFFISSFSAMKIALGNLPKINVKTFMLGLLIGSLAFMLFVVVALFRAGSSDFGNLVFLMRKIYSVAFGHLTGFSVWFDDYRPFYSELALGKYSVAGIFDALGISKRELGLFQNYILLHSGFLTNIFTVFRPLIEDFGIIGCISILILMGFSVTSAYSQVYLGRLLYVPVLSAFYSFVLMSFNTSVWIWNTVIVAFVFYSGVFWVAIKREKIESGKPPQEIRHLPRIHPSGKRLPK